MKDKKKANAPALSQPVVSSQYFTDARDGREYRAVEIGGLAENLNYNAEQSYC